MIPLFYDDDDRTLEEKFEEELRLFMRRFEKTYKLKDLRLHCTWYPVEGSEISIAYKKLGKNRGSACLY